jgi:hypothetical protein
LDGEGIDKDDRPDFVLKLVAQRDVLIHFVYLWHVNILLYYQKLIVAPFAAQSPT